MASVVLLAKKSVVATRRWGLRLLSRLPWKAVLDRPVFLTGCGRSGTTILGRALSHHPAITYLNEPRYIWIPCYPQTDIWSARAPARNGRLRLAETDCAPDASERLLKLFYVETLVRGRPRLVEKWPVHNFRLPFVHAIFPDALFIHIVRHGTEVARSIERWGWRWYGTNDYKWKQLAAYARGIEKYRELPELCHTTFECALLEWRLSVETALEFFESRPGAKWHQLTYAELNEEPVGVLERIQRFIGVEPSEKVRAFAVENIKRRTPQALPTSISEKSKQIAGDLFKRLGYLNE